MPAKGELPPQPNKETTSLAELSRRYLKGEIGLEDYLMQERVSGQTFGEISSAAKEILREVKEDSAKL